MYRNLHKLLAVLLTLVALAFGQTAQATVTQSIVFKGKVVNGGYVFIIGEPTMNSFSAQGTSVTFNNQTVVNQPNLQLSINGTLSFVEANDYTNVTTSGTVTLTFDSPTSNSNPVPTWYYGAKVKNMAGAIQGSSYSISNNRRTITVTIPDNTSFYYVELEQVPNAPMTEDNTTVTVPAGDYWVSDGYHKPQPEPTVVYNNTTTLVKDTDYTLSWLDNSSAGIGKARITGRGNYAGIVDGTFPIRWATYTVHFDKNHNDATGTMSDQQFTYSSSQYLTANAFTRTGCTFNRWYTNPEGSGTYYTNGQLVNNLTVIDGETVTLYAKWNVINYNITYNLNGGNANNPATYNVETESFTLNNPYRTGYHFDGWTGTDLTEATQTVTIAQGSTGDRSYTANWTPITYTIHFDANTGEGSMDDQTFTFDVSQSLTANAFTHTEYDYFLGWNTKADGTGASYTDGESLLNLTAIDGEIITFYAMWDNQNYNITYDLDGGYAINPDNYSIMSPTFTLNNPIKEGYIFAGWTGTDLTEATLTVTIVQGSSGDRSYTAHWLPFNGWTGTGTEDDPYIINSTVGLDLLATEVNNGNTFDGQYFLQTDNITYYYTTNNFTPIGNTTPFQGHYNGGGFTISGIYVDVKIIAVGLFGLVSSSGSVENIILANSTINGAQAVGGIVGLLPSGSVSNCRVESDVTIGDKSDSPQYHGGIVGYAGISGNTPTSITIAGCTSAASISGGPRSMFYGGIVGGCTKTTVKDCLYTGNTVHSSNNKGAIAGWKIDSTAIFSNNYYTESGVPGGVSNKDIDGARRGYTITLQNENIVFVGDQTSYNNSGITAIGENVLCYNNGTNTTYYSGKEQTVTLGPKPGFNIIDVNVNGNPANDNGNGTWSFTMPDANVTVTATVEANTDSYELFSGNLVEGDYLIVYNLNGKLYSMNNVISSDHAFQYEVVNAIDNVITTDNADIVWHIAPNDDGNWTIYNAAIEKYAGGRDTNGAQLYDETNNCYDETNNCATWIVGYSYEFQNCDDKFLGFRTRGTAIMGFYVMNNNDPFNPIYTNLLLYKKVEVPTETYTLEIEGYNDDESGWYLIASPVSTTPSKVGNMLTDETEAPYSYDLYRFNQAATAEWENYHQHSSDFNIIPGKGYLYANSQDVTLTFTGVPYSGNGQVTLVKDDNASLSGWNLVGNPFAANATISGTPFYRMNAAGTEIIASETNTVDAMEGIFVHANNNGDVVVFTPASQNAKGNNGNDASLVINLSKGNCGGAIDRAIVRFDGKSTMPKLQIFKHSDKLYIPQGGEEYAIVSVGRDVARYVSTEVPINFKAKENGEYTITVNPEGVAFGYLHLIDNLTGADVDLLASPSYTFEAHSTDYESRFKLVFSTNGDGPSTGSGAFAFINNGNIIVNGEGTVQVVDVMGRIVYQGDAINRVSTGGMTAGVYVLRLINGEDVFS